jgi:hypothetical protein
MASAKGAAASTPKAAEAAIAETTGQPRTIDFRGLKLTGPPELGASLLMDIGELQDETTEDAELPVLRRILLKVFGRKMLDEIGAKLDADGITLKDAAEHYSVLFNDIMDTYGMDAGEAEASDAS